MRDELIHMKPDKTECAIINLDSKKGSGTHWVCYRKTNKQVDYFDSYGNLKPPLELVRYLGNCNIYFNHDRYQFLSYNCGHLCLMFLHNKR